MRPQWYDEIVNSIGRVISSQNYGLVLPIVVVGIPVGAMLTYL